MDSDQHLINATTQIRDTKSPSSPRDLFITIIIIYKNLTDAVRLQVLIILESGVVSGGGRSLTVFGIDIPSADDIRNYHQNLMKQHHDAYDTNNHEQRSGQFRSTLNGDQQTAFEEIEIICSPPILIQYFWQHDLEQAKHIY